MSETPFRYTAELAGQIEASWQDRWEAEGTFPLVVEETVTCVLQVNGKVRARLEVPADIREEALRDLALAQPRIQKETSAGVRTVTVRAPRLVNVVLA